MGDELQTDGDLAIGGARCEAKNAELVRGRRQSRCSLSPLLLLPPLALVIAILVHWLLPTWQTVESTDYTWVLIGALALFAVSVAVSLVVPRLGRFLVANAPLLAVGALILIAWDVLTGKSHALPAPFFPTPDKIVAAFTGDWQKLLISAAYSIRLLAVGYAFGASIGFVTGVAVGWSPRWSYWITPFMRLIGPIPATAWIPIALVVFPTSFWASVFLLALSSWFPVAVMTSSGIANAPKSYFEVARTLGAKKSYLIRRVAIPAAFPSVFIGLFMGLAMAMLTLIVAELLGVKAGLGWYINWAEGWAEYGKVYASLLVIALLFLAIITAMFKIKDRLLKWQKGLVRW